MKSNKELVMCESGSRTSGSVSGKLLRNCEQIFARNENFRYAMALEINRFNLNICYRKQHK